MPSTPMFPLTLGRRNDPEPSAAPPYAESSSQTTDSRADSDPFTPSTKSPSNDMEYVIYFPHLQPQKERVLDYPGLELATAENGKVIPGGGSKETITEDAGLHYVRASEVPEKFRVEKGMGVKRSVMSMGGLEYSPNGSERMQGETTPLATTFPDRENDHAYIATKYDGAAPQGGRLNRGSQYPESSKAESNYAYMEVEASRRKNRRWKLIALGLAVLIVIGAVVGGTLVGLKMRERNVGNKESVEKDLSKDGSGGDRDGTEVGDIVGEDSITRPPRTIVTGVVVPDNDEDQTEDSDEVVDDADGIRRETITFPSDNDEPQKSTQRKPSNTNSGDKLGSNDRNSQDSGGSNNDNVEDDRNLNDDKGQEDRNSNGDSKNNNDDDSKSEETPPSAPAPPKRKSIIRSNSGISAVGVYRGDDDYDLSVFYQDESNGLRRLVYESLSNIWSSEALDFPDVKAGTPIASTVYKRNEGLQIQIYYLSSSNCVMEHNYYKQQFFAGDNSKSCRMQASGNSQLSAYWPSLHYQSPDNKVTEVYWQKGDGWKYPGGGIGAPSRTGIGQIPITKDHTAASVFIQVDGDKVLEYGWDNYQTESKRQWRLKHTFTGIPIGSRIATFARLSPIASRNELDRHFLYQDMSNGDILYYYIDEDKGTWQGPKRNAVFKGATKGTDISCITPTAEYYGKKLPESNMSLMRCYFQIDKRIKEVVLKDNVWLYAKTFDLSK